MTVLVVLGTASRVSDPSAIPLARALADPPRAERVLVLGTTADVAAVARHFPEARIAFSGARELERLFALDPSPDAGGERLRHGTEYPVDVGMLTTSTATHPFLGTVVAGGGAATTAWGFPWAGTRGDVVVTGTSRPARVRGRTMVVANGQHWMGWTVAPRAAINDGVLDVQVVDAGIGSAWALRRGLDDGWHDRHPGLRRLRITAATCTVPDSWRVRADGLVRGRGAFSVAIAPRQCTLLV